MRITIIGGTLVLASALVGVGVVGTGAYGATTPAVQAESPAGKVSAKITCYNIWINDFGEYRRVTIKNKCGQTKRARAIIASAPNGPCWTIKNGGYRTHYYTKPGTFYNLRKC